jgi:hypothetical protein
MVQLLLHLIGDYLFQNDWIAKHKARNGREGAMACIIHCVLYSVGFLAAFGGHVGLLVGLAHYIIDRNNLTIYWIQLINFRFTKYNFGFDSSKPVYLSQWLYIGYDNIFHLLCNFVIIKYFAHA